MEIETVTQRKTTGNPYVDLQAFDLPAIIHQIKHNQSWLDGELNAMVLVKKPSKQIVLTALHEGTIINSFQSSNSITFQIIEGRLKFHTQAESVMLNRGQLLTFRDKLKYSLTTEEDTVLLLTIVNNELLNSEN